MGLGETLLLPAVRLAGWAQGSFHNTVFVARQVLDYISAFRAGSQQKHACCALHDAQ